jgi:DNA-binding IclR family transcriptional regulator
MIVEGSWGIGVAVLDNRGMVRGSLSIAAIESRMQSARREKLGRLLFAERDRV